jgi:hypothetical protein
MMLSADDRMDMIDAIARYNNASDTRVVEDFVAEFAEDARFSGGVNSNVDGLPAFSFTVGGTEATPRRKEHLRTVLPGMFDHQGTHKRHLATNFAFRPRPDGRVDVDYVLFVLEAEAAPAVGATAWVTNRFRHEGGRWLVEEHALSVDPSVLASAR